MEKKHNLVKLPSPIYKKGVIAYFEGKLSPTKDKLVMGDKWSSYNLYCYSDWPIQIGDWVYDTKSHKISKMDKDYFIYTQLCGNPYRKIIITTDVDLELPNFETSFIEKYCENNGTISHILVEYIGYVDCSKTGYVPIEAILKVSSKNTVYAKSAKDSWNRKEVVKLIHDVVNEFGEGYSSKVIDDWIGKYL